MNLPSLRMLLPALPFLSAFFPLWAWGDTVPAVSGTQAVSMASSTSGISILKPVAAASAPAPALSLWQGLPGLLLVLGFLAFFAWFLKRFRGGKQCGNTHLRVIESIHVGTRERVVLLEAGDQWLAVGVSATGIQMLATLPVQVKQEREKGTTSPAFMHNPSGWLAKNLNKTRPYAKKQIQNGEAK